MSQERKSHRRVEKVIPKYWDRLRKLGMFCSSISLVLMRGIFNLKMETNSIASNIETKYNAGSEKC